MGAVSQARAAPLLDPAMPQAAKLEAKAVQFGHVRMCMTLEADAQKAQDALSAVLDACPDFFATRELPRLLARAIRSSDPAKPDPLAAAARAKLTALGKAALLDQPAFRDAVRYYVLDSRLLERGETYQDKAAPVLAKLRERENAALCWQTTSCLSTAVSAMSTTPAPVAPGPLTAEVLARDACRRCEPQTCAATGKATFQWNGTAVSCITHGPLEPEGKLASEEALRKAAAKNPMIWGVDHLRRMLDAEFALQRLSKSKR